MDNKKLDGDFEYFIEKLGRTDVYRPASPDIIEAYRGKVADALLNYWEIEGFRAYGDRLIWLTNPAEYQDVLDLYLKDTPFERIDTFYVFARTAFGDLYAVGERLGQTITIDITYNLIITQDSDMKKVAQNRDEIIQVEFMMGNKVDYDFEDEKIDDYDSDEEEYDEDKYLFKRAVEKLGTLEWDEVYGFNKPLDPYANLGIDELVKKNIFDYIKETRLTDGIPQMPYSGVNVDYDTMTVSRS